MVNRAAISIACALIAWGLLPAAVFAAPPKLNLFYPAGGQRGQSVDIVATGEFAAWPVQVWCDRPGVACTCEADKGKLKIAIAADAVPGVYWLRLADPEGASVLRPFVVGTLPEVLETEPNDAPGQPQAVQPRVAIGGKLGKSGDVDGFAVELKQGQLLVAAVQANCVLGSPLDAVLQVCELVERKASRGQPVQVEAYVAAQNHDAVGLDPQLAFTAPRDGRYLVRLFAFPAKPNSTIGFAGGENYVYRLTLTTGGYLDHALPLALPRAAAQVQLAGWNLPAGIPPLDVPAADSPPDSLLPPDGALVWLFHPEMAGAVALPRGDRASLVAAEACDLNQPQQITLPASLSGRLEVEGDADAFAFAGAKDQRVRVRAGSRSLGFPTDAFVAILDGAGKVVAEQDDGGREERDPQLDAVLPADGPYRVLIHDLHGRGGLRYVYRLTIETPQPDFDITLASDSFVLAGAGPLEIPLTVTGRDGFGEPVEIRVLGLPAGVTAEPLTVEAAPATANAGGKGRRGGRRGGNPAPAAANAKLILKGDPAAIQPGGAAIRIEGRFKDEEGELVRSARFALGLPLTEPHWAAWLTVRQ